LLTCLQHNFPICWLLSNHQTSPPDWTPVLSVRVDTSSVKCDHSLAAQAASVADTFEQACITPRTETGQAGLDAGDVPQPSLPAIKNTVVQDAQRPNHAHRRSASETSNPQPLTAAVPVEREKLMMRNS
jgi:hypothetical protein